MQHQVSVRYSVRLCGLRRRKISERGILTVGIPRAVAVVFA